MTVTIKKITIITNKNKPQQKYFYCGLFVVSPGRHLRKSMEKKNMYIADIQCRDTKHSIIVSNVF